MNNLAEVALDMVNKGTRMTTATTNPNDLTGVALDMAVALLLYEPSRVRIERGAVRVFHEPRADGSTFSYWRVFSPTTKWSDGGPLLEEYRIIVVTTEDGTLWDARRAGADSDMWFRGNTPLVAGMRCLVGSSS